MIAPDWNETKSSDNRTISERVGSPVREAHSGLADVVQERAGRGRFRLVMTRRVGGM